jgi:type VI secretion system secreted protein VgrG
MNTHGKYEIFLHSDGLPNGEEFVFSLMGYEKISQLFEFEVVVSPEKARLHDPSSSVSSSTLHDTLINQDAYLEFRLEGEVERTVYGMVRLVETEVDGDHDGIHRHRVWFVPRAWRTSINNRLEIHMDVKPADVIQAVLERCKFQLGDDFEFRLNGTYPTRDYITQYNETDLAFISRLAEHYGIAFFFEHGERDVMVFSDDNSKYPPLADDDVICFLKHGSKDKSALTNLVKTFGIRKKVLPEDVCIRDYNDDIASVPLESTKPVTKDGRGTVYEFGPNFKLPAEGVTFAQIRSEELLAREVVYQGTSHVLRLGSGQTCTLSEHPDGDYDMLVTEVRHSMDPKTAYANEFKAIPSDTIFRPKRKTKVPKVKGVLTAKVEDGIFNRFAKIDKLGKYTVSSLPFLLPQNSAKASLLIRMMQGHSGPNYGIHFPIKPGTEVAIGFYNGDPDRPLILGTVPNSDTVSPVHGANPDDSASLDNATTHIIRTVMGITIELEDGP